MGHRRRISTRSSRRSARRRRSWIGHSFGGRLAFELAARASRSSSSGSCSSTRRSCSPGTSRSRRRERPARSASYVSSTSAIDRRYDESQLHRAPRELVVERARGHLVADDDGRWRYRYSPGGRRRRVRRDGVHAAAVRRRPRPDAPRPRRATRTCRTTTCSTRIARRSATCSRSSSSRAGTRSCGTRSTRRRRRSRRSCAAEPETRASG